MIVTLIQLENVIYSTKTLIVKCKSRPFVLILQWKRDFFLLLQHYFTFYK